MALLPLSTYSQKKSNVIKHRVAKKEELKLNVNENLIPDSTIRFMDDISKKNRSIWTRYIESISDGISFKEKPSSGDMLINNIKNYTDTVSNSKILYRKYSDDICKLIKYLSYHPIQIDEYINFISSNGDIPIHFLKYRHNSNLVFFTGIYSKNVYNKYRKSEKERAHDVLVKILLPATKLIVTNFSNTELQYIGLSVDYGAGDFTKTDFDSGESLFIILPFTAAKSFASGQITEDEIISSGDYFMLSSDTPESIKKQNIVIQ
jgi:hypothetical protein